jgi:DNA modification methylase
MLEPDNIYHGNCLELIRNIPDNSIDAIISDPPYPYVKRDYGYWIESEWLALMQPLTLELKRVLKPTGSVVLILQPNSNGLGSMRPWLWKYLVWCCENWNVLQDVYWWNNTAIPEAQAIQGKFMRPSIKYMVWLGDKKCYRNQDAILWLESEETKADRLTRRATPRTISPSGHGVTRRRILEASAKRGGVTPFNLLPLDNADSTGSAGAYGHGAGTPQRLVEWWIKYISKPGDIVLDPFMGSGTTGIVAVRTGRHYLGFEKMPNFVETALSRIKIEKQTPKLFFLD